LYYSTYVIKVKNGRQLYYSMIFSSIIIGNYCQEKKRALVTSLLWDMDLDRQGRKVLLPKPCKVVSKVIPTGQSALWILIFINENLWSSTAKGIASRFLQKNLLTL
jgi:hypothetical protein